MEDIRLNWEPKSLVPLAELEEKFQFYADDLKSSILILKNGSLLFVKVFENENDEVIAKKCVEEAKFFIDFRTVELKQGGWLVGLHDAVAVYVSFDEYKQQRAEIKKRFEELKFPGEEFFNQSNNEDHFLIGVYARGKLQYDVHNFAFFKRVAARVN